MKTGYKVSGRDSYNNVYAKLDYSNVIYKWMQSSFKPEYVIEYYENSRTAIRNLIIVQSWNVPKKDIR